MTFPELLIIAGRMLLGGLFVVAGIRHFFILPVVTVPMMARGIPMAKRVLIVGSIFEICAGVLLAINFHAAWAALGLVAFTLVASWMLLDFWNKQGVPRHGAINGWMSNIGVVGGLLIVAASGL